MPSKTGFNMNRYLILTNDTEALPNRATDDHVKRLMWGEHENGTAGVREMAAIAREFNGKITFFVDICGALNRQNEVLEVARWLNENGQDVELHLHPEYLPDSFWEDHHLKNTPRWMNQYQEADRERLRLLIKTFGGALENVIGRKINAYRAGSFRWNSLTLETLKEAGIPLAFNNTRASVAEKQCPYAASMQTPFLWSNGIIEVPVTERNFFPQYKHNWWVRFQYPLCSLVRYRTGLSSHIPYSVSPRDQFLVCLMHSWSFLYRDSQGYEYYKDDKRLEDFRTLLRKMSRDFDIIDSRDLKYLIDSGKLEITHTEDLAKSVFIPEGRKYKILSREKNFRFNKKILRGKSNPGNCDNTAAAAASENELSALQCCVLPETIYKYIRSEKNNNLYRFSLSKKEKRTQLVITKKITNKIHEKQYIPLNIVFRIKDFNVPRRVLPLHLEVSCAEVLLAGVFFYNNAGQLISSTVKKCNCDTRVKIPRHAKQFSISIRVPDKFCRAELSFLAMTPMEGIIDSVFPE